MTLTSLEVERLVAWAAQECEWQGTKPVGVSNLVGAYFSLSLVTKIDASLIQRLGHWVEPEKNHPTSWRKVNVAVGNHLPPSWHEVPRLMDQFLGAEEAMSPTELFREFEEIHPFRDGNGRVGALLYNWWNGNMEPMKLEFPPNLWADGRREGVQL